MAIGGSWLPPIGTKDLLKWIVVRACRAALVVADDARVVAVEPTLTAGANRYGAGGDGVRGLRGGSGSGKNEGIAALGTGAENVVD